MYAVRSVPMYWRDLDVPTVEVGWPLPYVLRENPYIVGVSHGFTDTDDFQIWRLLADLLAACAVALAAVALPVSCLRYWATLRQFSVRTLFCVVTIVGVLSALYAYSLRQQHVEQSTVAELRAQGWDVLVSEGVGLPEWLFRLLHDLRVPGLDPWRRVIEIQWHARKARGAQDAFDINDMLNDAGPLLGQLTYLDSITLDDPRLVDRGIAALCRNVPTDALWELEIAGSSGVTDDAVTHIVQAWPNLEALDIADSSVSDAGLSLLAATTRLRRVGFPRAPYITKTGILKLLYMPTLEEIDIPLAASVADEEDDMEAVLESRGIHESSKW